MSKRIFIIFLAAPFALCGCSDAKRALGFEKSVPDEFRVVSQPPLSMPPEYGLRPPQPGAPRPQQREAGRQAEERLTGGGTSGPSERSAAESTLLKEAGTHDAPANIRELVDEESQTVTEEKKSEGFWGKVMKGTLLVDKEGEEKESKEVLDPSAELERMRGPSGSTSGNDGDESGDDADDVR